MDGTIWSSNAWWRSHFISFRQFHLNIVRWNSEHKNTHSHSICISHVQHVFYTMLVMEYPYPYVYGPSIQLLLIFVVFFSYFSFFFAMFLFDMHFIGLLVWRGITLTQTHVAAHQNCLDHAIVFVCIPFSVSIMSDITYSLATINAIHLDD